MSAKLDAVTPDLNNDAVVGAILENPEIRKIPVGTQEFTDAANKIAAETKEEPVTSQEPNESEPNDEVSAEADEVDDGEPVKSKKGFTKRINHLVQEREAARAEAAAARAELEQLRNTEGKPTENHIDYSKGFDKPKPEFNQFNDLGTYTEALSDWKDEQREYSKAVKAQTEQYQAAVVKNAETWEQREVSVKKELEDYDAVVNVDALETVDLTKPNHIASRTFLAESEFGPQVLYALLNDEELAAKFKDATPVHQVKILTKLESTFDAKTDNLATNTTTQGKANLPTPPTKLKAGHTKVESKPLDKITDFAEYARIRDAEEKARGRR